MQNEYEVDVAVISAVISAIRSNTVSLRTCLYVA